MPPRFAATRERIGPVVERQGKPQSLAGDDSKCYTNRYPDICKSFCSSPGQCDIKKAFEHFHHGAGQAEGRIWGCGRGDGKTPTSGECPGTLTATAPRHYKGTEHVPGGPARKVPTPIVVPPELGPVPESWPVRVVGGLDCSLPRWGANATTANGKTLALFAYNFGNFRNEIAAFSYFRDYKGWTHRYLRRADLPLINRGAAAAATWIFL